MTLHTPQIPMPRIKNRGLFLSYVGALVAIIAWGMSFINTRLLLDHGLTPVEIYIYRFTIAYIILLIFCHKRIFSNNWRDEILLALCGTLAGSIYFLAENFALEYTLTTNVSLITTTSPLFTALFIGLFYRSERPGAGMVIGSVVAFLGVACVIFNSSFVLKVNPIGDLLSLAAAISFAIYQILLRRLNTHYTVTFITRKVFFYGVLTALPFLFGEPKISPLSTLLDPTVFYNMLVLSIFASLIGFVAWSDFIKRVGAVKASNWLYLQPVVTLIAAALILSEAVTWVGYLGCGMILFGVWLSDFLNNQMKIRRSRRSERNITEGQETQPRQEADVPSAQQPARGR